MTSALSALAERRRQRCFPSRLRDLASEAVRLAMGLMFPHFAQRLDCDPEQMSAEVEALRSCLRECRRLLEEAGFDAPEPDAELEAELLALSLLLERDAAAIMSGDPAATSEDEVLLSYPGFFAIACYRLAHRLHELGYPLLPRLISEHAHQLTGVDIHPAAEIGSEFMIDHGTGVVIGATAVIGNRVKVYQGVTLGALVVSKELAGRKRHPTLEDDVVVYSNATILGGDTVVGRGSVIGGNVWLTSSVPPNSVVTHRSEVRIRNTGEEYEVLDFNI